MPPLDNYKGFNLWRGLWYDRHTRIFTVGGPQRIAEISNHPRVYEDKTYHIYEIETPFTVTERDLIEIPEERGGGRGYYDRREDRYYRLGEAATHHKDDSLPGGFPKWLEHVTPQPVTRPTALTFPLTAAPRPIELLSASLLDDVAGGLTELTGVALEELKSQLGGDEVVLTTWTPGKRCTLYFHYLRRFR